MQAPFTMLSTENTLLIGKFVYVNNLLNRMKYYYYICEKSNVKIFKIFQVGEFLKRVILVSVYV